MKGMSRVLGLLLVTLSAAPASAGTLYKCVSGDGITSYLSKRQSGAACSVISSYTPDRSTRRTPPSSVRATPGSIAGPARRIANIDSGAPATIISQPVSQTPRRAAEVASAVVPRALPGSETSIVQAPAAATAVNPRRVVSGQVYSYMKDGVRHYTSARPRQVASIEGLRTIHYSFIETCYACGAKPGVNFGAIRLNTNAYQQEITAAAREFGVEEAIVRAIIHAESAYNPLALSRAGAQGLMQLMPGTARRFGVSDAYDASQNIRGGVQYLSWLLKRFNGDLTLAAAGYNAGEGAVDRYGGVPPYSETQRYVQRVGLLAGRYRGQTTAAN
ncbi:lytic transglycosylase domain-containing protein [Xanthomonas hortorum]|uniref:Lytic transglycosylase domain-containing protein n=1 Tax=Xanthomonas hortorum pv. pelargonii TaxID=453602 RepID=A0A6V7CUS8_9XANT|nr:lytic transglycosylase domain-containing protein [Xanthomonas hortorum]MCE4353308.1 transglycosylase SLT domain-containing protein [Xanthomonas hortorum pv. pelargonii]MCM5524734.1 transglycosylase SLT domain-containing protein [Xanthomonas hortorum pv. pelargonii]MCM5537218.1 transglycosylase SLT domain-containing protein [Xanthomonas hortorum pv. pelargonii]MCM5541357.1 transglycosylase SLT domain-containing protein [Xanthomonas hortorum pv. pelargonii]MCM5544715.1 transglycosylase SLT do